MADTDKDPFSLALDIGADEVGTTSYCAICRAMSFTVTDRQRASMED